MKLYLATSNLHKIDELKKMLSEAGLNREVHTAEAVGGMPEVIEDQDTFSGNALKKARALAALLPSDGLALADDSGICIEAFDGAPGVRSARYAGEDATDESNTVVLGFAGPAVGPLAHQRMLVEKSRGQRQQERDDRDGDRPRVTRLAWPASRGAPSTASPTWVTMAESFDEFAMRLGLA